MKKLFSNLLGLLIAAFTATAHTQTLRVAGAGDISGFDPHSRNEAFSNRLIRQIYEPLLRYDAQLRLQPALAMSWRNPSANQWIVQLRQGVRFSQGASFSAQDVVYSIQRAQHEDSAVRHYALPLGTPMALDAHTVQFSTPLANPVFLEQLAQISIMPAAWSREKSCTEPASAAKKILTSCVSGEGGIKGAIGTSGTNGTGPLQLSAWKPGVEIQLAANPTWWGKEQGRVIGTEKLIYRPTIQSSARIASLLAGDLDLAMDLSPSELGMVQGKAGLQTITGIENRVLFLGFKQGRNDVLRAPALRQALAHAIDHAAIRKQIYRERFGTSASLVLAGANGYTAEHEGHLPIDLSRAKALGQPLAATTLTLGCPNDRHPLDVPLCKALAAMWAKAGIKVQVQALPKAIYFSQLAKANHSFDIYLMSWGGATTDASFYLGPLAHGTQATDNYGAIQNPLLDALLGKAAQMMDPKARTELLSQALAEHARQLHHLPLGRQHLLWAASSKWNYTVRADGMLDVTGLKFVP